MPELPRKPAEPTQPPDPSHRGGVDVWQKIGWLDLAKRGFDSARAMLPSFNHSIQIAVAGGPNADIRRLWYLCVSATFGRFRNRVRTAAVPISLSATWDVANKVVSLEINYSANQLDQLEGDRLGFSSVGLADPGGSASALMSRGPEQVTVGGAWERIFLPSDIRKLEKTAPSVPQPKWIALLTKSGCIGVGGSGGPVQWAVTSTIDPVAGRVSSPGLGLIDVLKELPHGAAVNTGEGATFMKATRYPYAVSYVQPGAAGGGTGPRAAVVTNDALPRLPDEHRIITTNEKFDRRVQPPKPHVDGVTRSSFLSLVAASLQTPCYLPQAPPCTRNPAGSSGVFARAASDGSGANPKDMEGLWEAAVYGKWPLADDQGPDGYPLPPLNTVTNYGG